MKKIHLASLLSAILFGLSAQGQEPIVMTINGKDIHRSEFEYIWHKNNSQNMSVEEYADLFVLFKLKVAEAEAQGLDTTQNFIQELNGYRGQLTPDFFVDAETESRLKDEAYQMMQTYVELSHLLVSVDRYAAPEDTLAVYQKLVDLRQQILKGKKDFADVAREISEDNSKEKGGYLGTMIASRYIYRFAKAAIATPIGSISMPVRSQYGYHLIKVHRSYPTFGQYLSGHILKAAPFTADQVTQEAARKEIHAIYQELQQGVSFAQLANTRNDDQYVVGKDGLYQTLRCGALPIEYENAIAALKDGEYSKPFQSNYGWHIVKRIAVEPFPEKESIDKELDNIIHRDERAQAGKLAMIEKWKKEYHYVLQADAFKAFEEIVLKHGKFDSELISLTEKVGTLAQFDENKLEAKDFADFLSQNAARYNIRYLSEAFDTYLQTRITTYEDSRLESKYPEFGLLMKEYHDGILLFEVSNREVWEKATIDTAGLTAYFDKNRSKYAWDVPRFKGSILYCADTKAAKKVKKMAKKLPQDSLSIVLPRLFNNDSTIMVKSEYGLFAKGENPIIDKLAFKTGQWTAGESYPAVWLQGKTLTTPEVYTDVHGIVSTDYQNYLEEEWLKKLREKYPVVIHQDVLKDIR